MFTIKIISGARSSSLPTLYVSEEKSSLSGLIPKVDMIKLNYGTFRLDAVIKKVSKRKIPSNELVINEAMCNKLYLKNGQKLYVKMTPQGELDLGPLIGYFISSEKISKLKLGKHDTVYEKFFDLISTLGGELFLFSLDDVDWSQFSVRGYRYNSDSPGELSTFQYPIPRVIYNRCFGPECKNQVEQLILRTSPYKNIIVTSQDITEFYCNSLISPSDDFQPFKFIDCKTEVSVLVQRDYCGTWKYAFGALKLIPPLNTPSNFFGNFPLESALREIFPVDYQKVKENLVASSIREAKKIGKNSQSFVDLEIKLAINSKGKVRVQAVNAKPQKTYISKFTGSNAAQLSIARPLHYCFNLAGFILSHDPDFSSHERRRSTKQPLIGIFEDIATCDEIKFEKKLDIYEQYIVKAGLELGCITYFFSIYDLQGTDCINGYCYDSIKQLWIRKEFPWPEVIYDRATFDRDSERQLAKQFRKDLKRFGKTMFLNSRSVFGKGYTSEILEKMPILLKYLPHNVNNPSSDTVKTLLEKYDSIFIKTEFGSDQDGVMKVAQQKQSYIISNKNGKIAFPGFEQMWAHICKIVESEEYVAQQGINAVIYRSEPLNVRSIIQKNGLGMWEVTLVKPWIATTPELEAFPIQWSEAFKGLFSSTTTANIHAEICYISLIVAKTLEAHEGHLGELGIDYVVDHSGHPWLIEVNGKTNKHFFIEDEIPDSCYKLFYNPIAYSLFLIETNDCYRYEFGSKFKSRFLS